MSRRQAAVRRAQAKERRNREPCGGLSGQLRGRGLRIREVPGDGNCLFRALGDQLEGHSRNHLKHRQETVDYMIQQRRDFEPFVEDDVPFDKHVASLAKPGTFAGNDAIVAFARNHQVQVVIHQLNNPLWQIRGTDKADARELHIVYRYGEHYDSVRRLNDNSETPANLQTQMLCKDGANKERNQPLSPEDEPEGGGNEDFQHELDEAVHKVRNATGCSDVNLILQNLEAESYDIESAVIAILQTEEFSKIDGEYDSPEQQVQEQQTPRSTLFEDGGSGARIFGNQEIHPSRAENPNRKQKGHNLPEVTESQKSPPTGQENIGNRNKPQKQPSNKQRKEQQRQEKKKRQEDRHRQKVLENRSNNVDNNSRGQVPSEGEVTLVKAFTALNI